MPKLRTHGITQDTPKNILLGAGAFYRDLVYDSTVGWSGTVLGATSGGGTVNLAPEYFSPDIDGATVLVQGLNWKVADEAIMKANMIELNEQNLVDLLHLKEDTTASVGGYKKFVSQRSIGDDAYLKNVGYVGTLTSGEQIIIIFPVAICMGALEMSTNNKETATYEVEFKCVATFEQEDLEHLPYEIYYPQAVTPPSGAASELEQI